MIRQVSILNTSIASNNLGDYIIMDSVRSYFYENLTY